MLWYLRDGQYNADQEAHGNYCDGADDHDQPHNEEGFQNGDEPFTPAPLGLLIASEASDGGCAQERWKADDRQHEAEPIIVRTDGK